MALDRLLDLFANPFLRFSYISFGWPATWSTRWRMVKQLLID